MTVQTVKDVADGAMLGGKYRIRRVLGQGGMGVVVEAVHVELDDRVAIKFLTPRASAEPDAVQRFVREAKAAVRLRSEHIARVRDVGLLPGGDPYIVMEYLDGVELRQLFSGPRLAPAALVDLIMQACEGLAEAHSHGIVHRDIKPSNLFVVTQVDGAPHVKVLDFGVSKVPVDDLNLTGTNSWMGTPAYMSPEQMRSTKNVDARSDLWSLAVVLYEGLEGRVPFPGDSLADLCINVTSMPPQPLTDRTPAALQPIVMKGLAKRPADRYETAAAFAEALAPFAETPAHAEMIVRRTRRMLDRRATPPHGVPAVDRVVAAPTEHLKDFAPPSPSAKLRAELDADLAAAFEVMKVDSAALATPPEDVAAARGVASPELAARAELDARSSELALGSGDDHPPPSDPTPSISGELDEVVDAGRRWTLGILAALAGVVVIAAIVLFAMRGDNDRAGRDAGTDRGGDRTTSPAGSTSDTASTGATPDASDVTTPGASGGGPTDTSAIATRGASGGGPTDASTVATPNAEGPKPDTKDVATRTPGATPDGRNVTLGSAGGDPRSGARPTRPGRPDPRVPAVPADAGVVAPADAAPAPPADAAPTSTPDADPLERRT